MQRLTLQRGPSTDEGTFGQLTVSGQHFVTGELPWRDNHSDVSCVPPGTYAVKMEPSHKLGRDVYHLQDVPGRTAVMIHNGNWCGDVTKGLKSNVEGCILLGWGTATMTPPPDHTTGKVYGPQKGVTASNDALAAFEKLMAMEPFELEILAAP